jgi:hypothetical protein
MPPAKAAGRGVEQWDAKVWNMAERAALARPEAGGVGLKDPDLLIAQRFPIDGKEAARIALYAIQFPKHRFEVHGRFLCMMDDSKNNHVKEGSTE